MHKSVQPYFSDSKEKSCFIAHTQKIYNKIICNRNFQQNLGPVLTGDRRDQKEKKKSKHQSKQNNFSTNCKK